MTSPNEFHEIPIPHYLRRTSYRIASLVWAAALLVGSLQPCRPANIHFGVLHNIAHVLGFGALVFLAMLGFGHPDRAMLWPSAGCFLLGFTIECLQYWHNQQVFEWYDVRDDAIGILVFAVLCHMVFRQPPGNNEKRSSIERIASPW